MRCQSAIVPLIAVCSVLSACSSSGLVEVGCAEFNEKKHISGETEVAVGDEITMKLCSNPTTGFQWSEQADISDNEVIEQVNHQYVGPSDEDRPPPPGTPGEEVWTFRAIGKGQSTVSVEYGRPWEGGEKATWTFVLRVIVY
jgi:inhibitor of cysteine peptidase